MIGGREVKEGLFPAEERSCNVPDQEYDRI